MPTSTTTLTVEADYTFGQIPEWVLDAGASSIAVHVLAILGLYTYQDRRGGIASHKKIAERAGKSVSTIRRGLDELVDLGALTVVARYDDEDRNRQTSNHYLIHHLPPANRGVSTGEQGGMFTCGQGPLSTGEQQIQSNPDLEQLDTDLAATPPKPVNYPWILVTAPDGPFQLPDTTKLQRNRVGKLAREMNATLDHRNLEGTDRGDALWKAVVSWPDHYPDANLTPEALEKHLSALLKAPLRASPSDPGKMQRRDNPAAYDAFVADGIANPKPKSEAQLAAEARSR